ncbi:class I SAM-dependent methyltransferase [Halosimplex aquaticum]|uniref:Class I SAM-dependent methyltransferase n=1 Tax=Halosimplex aquaticum TaxID=3026162 RepID=A0ABD5XZV0_9EURY|nr:class I SAM-dependent methyltransferase [Halosimplex aquaticum]
MSDATHDDTIDWHSFWTEADETDRADAGPSAHHATDAVADFIAETRVPDAFADVGCGPGHAAFAVAERYPETEVVGYDAAEPVLEENRDRARERGVENVAFERAVLPAFDPDREFDVVFSYFTLCYVADIERALRELYDAVAPGGYLVFNYQNRLARAHWRRMAENPEQFLGEDSQFDADRFEERFRLLLDGENLLSYDRIHDALGTWPQSVWSVVEKPDTRWAWRHHPLVYVPK